MNGTLPDDINRLSGSLQYLNLTSNNFDGDIPSAIGGLSQLKVLELAGNLFDGSFPAEIGNLLNLEFLWLSQNGFAPQAIPSRFDAVEEIEEFLDEEAKFGELPDSLGNCESLRYLRAENNSISGNLRLTSLNLSSNRLSGIIPTELEIGAFDRSFLNNPGLCASNPSVGLSSCKGKTRSDKFPVKLVAALASVAAVTFMVAVLYSLFVLRSRRKRKQGLVSTWKQISFHKLDFTESDIVSHLTENNIIGSGGSGQVYLVPLRLSGNYVAVKKIWSNRRMDHKHEKEFLAEVQILVQFDTPI
ncbi:hypothetical protein HAX54_017430 [Datura stramonium]|uniref:Protein kinase domain-containing protein n=1 Tax=Datura stramonium TaxID=4076 RepID=A0ABS8UKT8_DATST|nr:hypothetical protein [Datura stramonium]